MSVERDGKKGGGRCEDAFQVSRQGSECHKRDTQPTLTTVSSARMQLPPLAYR